MGGRWPAAALVLACATAAVAQEASDQRLRSVDPLERLDALRMDLRTPVGARTADVVLRLAAEDPHPQVRGQALRVLGAWIGAGGPPSSRDRDGAVAVLGTALTADSSWIRCGAADGLAAAGPAAGGARAGLLALLESEDWNYRWHSTMALEHVGPAARAALADLRRHAADESEHGHVRRGARKAIAAIEAVD